MKRAVLLARTYHALGLRNLARVGAYRLGLRTGTHAALRVRSAVDKGGHAPFFSEVSREPCPAVRNHAWDTHWRLYGHLLIDADADVPPDFLANPISGQRWRTASEPWQRIPDFDPEDGDVKMVWELSRFEWAPAFAQAARSGVPGALDRLNRWVAHWTEQTPAFAGPNWKCGQEASIRVLHLAAAALVLGADTKPTSRLLALVETHLRRVRPTLSYALGQDNNHGTSEATALFVGGSWLASCGVTTGNAWAKAGRRWLEERVQRLFLPDGTFSQYSVNYHRLALDTLVFAEVWRRRHGLEPFAASVLERLRAAGDWLHAMVDPETGDAPNLGHNDGARILALTDAPFRDYRPSVARAKALFADQNAYENPDVAADLAWLGIAAGTRKAPPATSRLFEDGGFAVLHRGRAFVLLRYPKFRFRPAHDDIMHIDVWLNGSAVLPDGGSYSYNAGAEWIDYFMGEASHNTIVFDARGHMPKLGRFLFGAWPTSRIEATVKETSDSVTVAVSYRDWCGVHHQRALSLADRSLRVRDACDGPADTARLRWRLGGQGWQRTGRGVENGPLNISVRVSSGVSQDRIVPAFEARHYAEKTTLESWEIDAPLPCEFETVVSW